MKNPINIIVCFLVSTVGCLTFDGNFCPPAELTPCSSNSDCCGFDPIGHALGESPQEYCTSLASGGKACTKTCTSDSECGGFECVVTDLNGQPNPKNGICLPKSTPGNTPFHP